MNKVSGSQSLRPIVIPKQEAAPECHQPPLVPGAGELGAPLAEVMRPTSIEEYVGQEGVIGKNAILRTILESGQVPSLIFWGPPGCGKVLISRSRSGKHGKSLPKDLNCFPSLEINSLHFSRGSFTENIKTIRVGY